MSDEKETTQTQTASGQPAPADKPPSQAAKGTDASRNDGSQPAKGGGRGALLLLLNILLLAGLGVLGFLYYEQDKAIGALFSEYSALSGLNEDVEARFREAEQRRSEQMQGLQEEVRETLLARIRELENQFEEQARADAEQLAEQAQRIERLNRELVSVRMRGSEAAGGSNQGWLLAEAQALLRLARQRLLNARDINTVISLYLAADDLLRQLDDPAVQSVRDILATELDTLRGVRLPDIAGMYTRLGELAGRLEGLAIADELRGGELSFSPGTPPALEADAGWLDELGASLSQYFVITRRDSEALPRMSAEQVYLVKQFIRLRLEEARLALLRGEQRLYQQALDEALADIDTYLQGPDKDDVVDALTRLRDAQIVPVIPPVGSALNALRQIAPAPGEGSRE